MRYEYLWRNKWLTAGAKSVEEMIAGLRDAADLLEGMKEDGLVLEDVESLEDDYAFLRTDDPKLAKKYDMFDLEKLEEAEDKDSNDPSDSKEPCGCRICELEMNAGRTMIRLGKVEMALVNAGLGSWCPECEDFIPAGEGCEPATGPLVPVNKRDMN